MTICEKIISSKGGEKIWKQVRHFTGACAILYSNVFTVQVAEEQPHVKVSRPPKLSSEKTQCNSQYDDVFESDHHVDDQHHHGDKNDDSSEVATFNNTPLSEISSFTSPRSTSDLNFNKYSLLFSSIV